MIRYGKIFFNLIRQFLIKSCLIFLFTFFNFSFLLFAQKTNVDSDDSRVELNEIYVYGSAYIVKKNVDTNAKIVIVSRQPESKKINNTPKKRKESGNFEIQKAVQKKKATKKISNPKATKIVTSSSENLKLGNAFITKLSVLNINFQIKFLLIFASISILLIWIKKQHDFSEEKSFIIAIKYNFSSIRPPPKHFIFF